MRCDTLKQYAQAHELLSWFVVALTLSLGRRALNRSRVAFPGSRIIEVVRKQVGGVFDSPVVERLDKGVVVQLKHDGVALVHLAGLQHPNRRLLRRLV
eukprot:5472382-Pyramimonas_sp.AAC.1